VENVLLQPLSFARGRPMANRFMLAPLTNWQSHEDGTLSGDELHWLTMRAKGGFGLVMTCAANVQWPGKGFPGQLGIWSDKHLPGLSRLAKAIGAEGSLSSVQLQHSGLRASRALTAEVPRAPWDDAETGAVALSTAEVEQVIEDFILAGLRAQEAGFDGVELHAAHGYLLCQFLDAERNTRKDQFGGSFENRTRVLFAVTAGLRERARPEFQIGVRISPERYGVRVDEARELARQLMAGGLIDYLDVSMWDVFKEAYEEAYRDRPLLAQFTDLPRGNTRLGAAGKLTTAAAAQAAMAAGLDYVLIGRGGILHHDFPRKVAGNLKFEPAALPVTRAYLSAEGLGPAFIDYMQTNWKDFVAG
jgi:2,4-dienoyl-CoA reductase-like NADH-dependent reductase (Old Yellow Enzyme family)